MNIEKNTSQVTIYKSKIIGAFFLLAFLAYGFGQNLFGSDVLFEKYIGALLIITNSILVIFIGIFLRKTLQKYNNIIGNIYLFSRVFEAMALVSIVMNLLPAINYFYRLWILPWNACFRNWERSNVFNIIQTPNYTKMAGFMGSDWLFCICFWISYGTI
jgi:hypothetical protein